MRPASWYARFWSLLLLASAGCSDSPGREADVALAEAGVPSRADATIPSDAGHDAAPDATASDAGGLGRGLAQASAQLMQIRVRTLVGPDTEPNDLDAQTAWWPIEGSVEFRTTAEGVDLVLHAIHCRTAYAYPVFIYADADCNAIKPDSVPWERGLLKSKGLCIGAPGVNLFESRADTDPKSWRLGGASASDLLGRTIAIHDPDTREPLACGVIQASDAGAPWKPIAPERRPSNVVIQQLAGVCAFGVLPSRTSDASTCPNQEKLSACLLGHCVAQCLDVCADHVACLERSEEICTAPCERSPACEACLTLGPGCIAGFCLNEFSCAPPPTPGGPCTQFRACCMRQGPVTEGCLLLAEVTERLSGDGSCLGALWDFDTNTNFTYRSPCYPDAGVDAGELDAGSQP